MDVVVDIRKASITYGQHVCFKLSENNKNIVWIPPGLLMVLLHLRRILSLVINVQKFIIKNMNILYYGMTQI